MDLVSAFFSVCVNINSDMLMTSGKISVALFMVEGKLIEDKKNKDCEDFITFVKTKLMLRFNPFNRIHKGLRALLYHSSLSLQRTDFSNEHQIKNILEKLTELIELFEQHAQTEEQHTLSMLKKIAPNIVADFKKLHTQDRQLGEELKTAIASVKEAKAKEARLKAAFQLQITLTEFAAFHLLHMNREETVLNEKLWQHFGDEEIMAVMVKLQASVPPDQMVKYAYWMLKGLSMNEIIEWYKDIKVTQSSSVFENHKQIAQLALSESEYETLYDALKEKAVA